MSAETLSHQTEIGMQLESFSDDRFIYIGEVDEMGDEQQINHVYVMAVKNEIKYRQVATYPDIIGKIEQSIFKKLIEGKAIPSVSESVVQGTHEEGEEVIFGRFSFIKDGKSHELLFLPTEKYGKYVLEYLQLIGKGVLSSDETDKMKEFSTTGMNAHSISRNRYNRLFGTAK